MADTSKLYLTNGMTYTVNDSPDSIYETLTHSDGKPKHHMHAFSLLNGDKVYVHASHVVAIEHADSNGGDNQGDDSSGKEHSHEKQNLEEVKEFKKDIDGNMD